jgi:hypothetical protein
LTRLTTIRFLIITLLRIVSRLWAYTIKLYEMMMMMNYVLGRDYKGGSHDDLNSQSGQLLVRYR